MQSGTGDHGRALLSGCMAARAFRGRCPRHQSQAATGSGSCLVRSPLEQSDSCQPRPGGLLWPAPAGGARACWPAQGTMRAQELPPDQTPTRLCCGRGPEPWRRRLCGASQPHRAPDTHPPAPAPAPRSSGCRPGSLAQEEGGGGIGQATLTPGRPALWLRKGKAAVPPRPPCRAPAQVLSHREWQCRAKAHTRAAVQASVQCQCHGCSVWVALSPLGLAPQHALGPWSCTPSYPRGPKGRCQGALQPPLPRGQWPQRQDAPRTLRAGRPGA